MDRGAGPDTATPRAAIIASRLYIMGTVPRLQDSCCELPEKLLPFCGEKGAATRWPLAFHDVPAPAQNDVN